jgi:thiol-disulfide isomerase/thioredoxin
MPTSLPPSVPHGHEHSTSGRSTADRSWFSRRVLLAGAAAAAGLTLLGSCWSVSDNRKQPGFAGATAWLNTAPLSPLDLDGRVVLADFWTLTCINWLRTAPYVRAWAETYRDDGLVVVGVHSPEFSFEHDLDRVKQATKALGLTYPVAVDSNLDVWSAFGNRYWPALYFLDTDGIVSGHHYGEGNYADSERTLQRLLKIRRPLVSPDVHGDGVEAAADWAQLRSPETYLGHARTENFASATSAELDTAVTFDIPGDLALNQWGIEGRWTVADEYVRLEQPQGAIAFRFHARDAHLVLATPESRPSPFRVTLDGEPPGRSHGVDVDSDGHGTLREGRLYQLIRTHDSVRDRTVKIMFQHPGAQAYCLTFG